ncbi:MAG: hypothetical protein MUC74_13720 [Ideonella sp.]|jgi:hypothetical protein|nr:hypothetical protein [Ideonella sp.]
MTSAHATQVFAPTVAPRGARVAAELAYRLLRAWSALRFHLDTAPALRAIEAGAVRQRAAEEAARGNRAFAADLLAAADRYETRR